MKTAILPFITFMFLMVSALSGFSQLTSPFSPTKSNEMMAENLMGSPVGVVIENIVTCTGLEGNVFPADAERKVSVYLPPGYFLNTWKSYPVVYLLGGYAAEHDFWFGGCDPEFKLNETLDFLINKKEIQPMIVVSPDNCNSFKGSWFTDSPLSGNWESFNASELVQFIDKTYRTLAQPESRGIAGCSMGGYGAVTLSMKHPDVFGSVYSISADMLDFTEKIINNPETNGKFKDAAQLKGFMNTAGVDYTTCFGMGIAFAPNSSKIGFCELPFSRTGDLLADVWQKWLEHDPVSMIPFYKENLLKLKAISMEYGEKDAALKGGTISFSNILNENGIAHDLLVHPADHDYSIRNRMKTHILPFFSGNLSAMGPSTRNRDLPSAGFMVYPNPADRTLIIHSAHSEEFAVELLDAAGKKVYSGFAGNNFHYIDISDISTGIYIVVLKTRGYAVTCKITKR